MRKILPFLLVLLFCFNVLAASQQPPNVSNATGTLPVANGGSGYNFPNWYAALNSVRTATQGTKIARVCVVGDSTTFGVGSNYLYASGNFPALSYPTQLATFLASDRGIKAHWNSFFGDGMVGQIESGSFDSRITKGSSWSQSSSLVSLGIAPYTASTTTNALSFLPTSNVDTFKIYYLIGSSNGIVSAQIGSGSVITQDTSTGTNNTIGSFTVSTGSAAASNTLNLKYVSGGAVNVIGAEAWDSTQNWVSVINMGISGSLSTTWNVNTFAYSPANSAAYAAVGCNLTIFNLGINDYDNGTGVPTFTTAMQNLITAAKAGGSDVLLMTPVPTSAGSSPIATQYGYTQALRGLAVSNALPPIVDMALRWQSFTVGAQNNFYSDTSTHPNASGYSDEAKAVLSEIVPSSVPNYPLGGVLGYGAAQTLVTNIPTAVPTLSIENLSTTGMTVTEYQGTNRQFLEGVGNTSTAFLPNLRGAWFVYDLGNAGSGGNGAVLAINSSGNMQVGASGGGGCNGPQTLNVCGNELVGGTIFQGSAAASNTNSYLETNANSVADNTQLADGILWFGAQNCQFCYGASYGYNATASRDRSRIFAPNNADISFAFHANGSAPTSQSSFVDHMVIRGDSEHVAYINGTAPAVTSCGSSPSIDANANDVSGTVTAGGGATGCVITFANAYASYNHCRITFESSLTAASYSYSLSAITLAATALSGKIDYECDGQ